jgi:hypothetical protein
MLPDPKWLDVVKWPLRTTIPIAIASSALLALTLTGVFDLGPIGPFTTPVLVIVSVLSVTQVVVGSIYELLTPWRERRRADRLSARRAVRQQEAEEQLTAARARVIASLDHLSKREIDRVAQSLRDGSPSFYTYSHSPNVSLLMAKGLVWTPGGAHHQDYYPFSFHTWVWEVLLERKDEFLAKDDEHKRADKAREEAERRRRRF